MKLKGLGWTGGGLTFCGYLGMGVWRSPSGEDGSEMELNGEDPLEAAPAARAAALLMSDRCIW